MKSRWITAALCVLAAVILIVRLVPHRRGGAPPGRKAHAANAYAGLRDLVLAGTRANFGLGPGTRPGQPFAVVADWGEAQGATTVIAVADGSASVYRSDGSGAIGGGQRHEAIRSAALRAVELAAGVQPSMQRANDYPQAGPGKVSFYLVTDVGVFAGTAAQDDLNAYRGPYAALAAAIREIEVEYGRVERR